MRSSSYKTMAGFCHPLFIEPLFSSSATIVNPELPQSNSTGGLYAVGRPGMLAKLFLRLAPTHDQLLVHDAGRVRDFAEWLNSLPPPVLSVTGTRDSEIQRQWWLQTNQHFPILKLPPELRCEILLEGFGRDLYRAFANNYSICGDRDVLLQLQEPYGDTLKSISPPTEGVLLVNRQIHNEISSIVRRDTRRCFRYPLGLEWVIRSLQPRRTLRIEHLQILELEFGHRDYMNYFAASNHLVPFRDLPGGPPRGGASLLRELPSSRRLIIRFRAPIAGARLDPWAPTGDHNGHDLYADWRGNPQDRGFHTSCQKILLDWILTFAKDYVKHIPKVTLTGYIKHSTKEKWDGILEDERRGIDHEMTQAMRVICSWPLDDHGPTCHCTKKCGWAGMYVTFNQPDWDITSAMEEYEHEHGAYEFDFGD